MVVNEMRKEVYEPAVSDGTEYFMNILNAFRAYINTPVKTLCILPYSYACEISEKRKRHITKRGHTTSSMNKILKR